MPLRDHFRPPLDNAHSWEELHGQWPAVIVQHLRKRLPDGYVAAPWLNASPELIIDAAPIKKDDSPVPTVCDEGNGGTATAAWSHSQPNVAARISFQDCDDYEVRVYTRRGRQLVAAVEIVSPANKDRPEHRNLFVAKCAALLQKGVAVSIVDLVTIRPFNLYAELLAFLGHSDPTLGDEPPPLYAVSCRWVTRGKRTLLEAWSHVLAVGRPLPTLPLWLSEDLAVPLDLERSYEQACSDLWIA